MRRTIGRSVVVGAVAASLMAALFVSTASGLSISQTWRAKVSAASRSNGTTTLYVYTNGTGAVALRLAGLAPSTSYAVSLYHGTCSALGSRFMTLATVGSTPSGTVTRGIALSTARTTAVRAALRTRVAVVVGSPRRCGTLARVTVTPTPSPTSSPTPSPTSSPTPSPSSTAAAIRGFTFSPAALTVTAGTTVTWTNDDSAGHTVTADDASFGSQTISKGQSFSHVFSKAGTYAYHCAIHSAMTATVIVR